jgi:hypothetical protein
MLTTACEIKFEMSFELKTGTAQSCRIGKILNEM